MDGVSFNKNYYNIFKVCSDFRQRLTDMQRLKSVKQQVKKKNVK